METPAVKENKAGYQERIMVISGKKIKSIPILKVAYFVSEGRYIRMITKTNEKYLLDYSLDTINQRVNPILFFRVNRQFIISFDAIREMTIWSRSRIKIEMEPISESEIISSINKTAEFRKWLDR